jgi:hypothetical protein
MTDPTATQLKSFDYTQDVTKQMITLSTGVIVITVSFFKEVFPHPPADAKTVIVISWGFFAISVLAGIATLLNLTGNLPSQTKESEGIYRDSIRLWSIIQIACFLLAIIGTIYFGARST